MHVALKPRHTGGKAQNISSVFRRRLSLHHENYLLLAVLGQKRRENVRNKQTDFRINNMDIHIISIYFDPISLIGRYLIASC